MAAVGYELQSFLEKFAHLSRLDVNTNLHFDSFNGKIFVNFQAELGYFRPTDFRYQHQANLSRSQRRRKRRKQTNCKLSLQQELSNSSESQVTSDQKNENLANENAFQKKLSTFPKNDNA